MKKLMPNKEESSSLRVVAFWPSSPSVIEEEDWKILKDRFHFLKIEEEGLVHGPASKLPYLAMDDLLQARRFLMHFNSDETDLLWAVRGGYGILRWAGMVVDQLVKRERYPVVLGFSDVSLIHILLFNANIPSIHGPMINTLKDTSDESLEALSSVLKGGTFPSLKGKRLIGGRARGRLLPVNLSCLVSSIGTRLQPHFQRQDVILAIEDHREPLYRIDRMLTQLLETGILEEVSGIAVGEILLSDNGNAPLLETLLVDRLSRLRCPVVYGLPFGHGLSNMPLLQGGSYELDGESGWLTMS